MRIKKRISWTVLVCVIFGIGGARGDIPLSSGYLCWSPHAYHLDPQLDVHTTMWSSINLISSYVSYVRAETTAPNGSPAVCTLAELRDRLRGGKGIVLYCSHGAATATNWVAVDSFGTDEVARDSQQAIYEAQYPMNVWGNSYDVGLETHYFIYISANVTTGWCQEFSPDRHGLSFTFSCGTQGQGYNCFNSKASFGYQATLNRTDAQTDISGIFGRMNGSIGSGQYRQAQAAWTNYNDPTAPQVKLYGVTPIQTMLCPIVTACPEDGVYPSAAKWAKTGKIKVSFSDPMEVAVGDSAPVSVSLPWTDCATVPGVNHVPRWVTTSAIGGDFKDASSGNKTLTVTTSTVRADIINGTIYADGDPTTPQNRDSVLHTFTVE